AGWRKQEVIAIAGPPRRDPPDRYLRLLDCAQVVARRVLAPLLSERPGTRLDFVCADLTADRCRPVLDTPVDSGRPANEEVGDWLRIVQVARVRVLDLMSERLEQLSGVLGRGDTLGMARELAPG